MSKRPIRFLGFSAEALSLLVSAQEKWIIEERSVNNCDEVMVTS